MRRVLLLAALLLCAGARTASARAPDTFEEDYHEEIVPDSPQWFAFELKVGPYQPGHQPTLKQVFDDDRGWLLNLELDVTVYHLPFQIGQLNVAAGWGWANYDAKAAAVTGGSSGEETELTLYPISALAVLRIDWLARQTVIPLTMAAKIGYEWVRWKATTGERTDGSGFNRGLRWGLQGALEIDFFDMESARRMDEEWGINHTFLLFEFFESKTRGTGDRTFQFGLGSQF